LPAQLQLPQQSQQPTEQELRPIGSPQDQQTAAGPAVVQTSALADPGHLGAVSGSYQSARTQALGHATSSSSLRSHSSSGSLQTASSSKTLAAQGALQREQQAQDEAAAQPSKWQRWFGSSKKEEELLLPVPMRAK
jgi:hypothetical protein